MKRYFYTEALAAAWMAHMFGMQYHGSDLRPRIRLTRPDTIIRQQHFRERFYIHPDSLPLLALHAGDLITSPSGVVGVYGSIGTINGIEHRRLFVAGSLRSQPLSGEEIIIQRNGTAFMWPESEDV